MSVYECHGKAPTEKHEMERRERAREASNDDDGRTTEK